MNKHEFSFFHIILIYIFITSQYIIVSSTRSMFYIKMSINIYCTFIFHMFKMYPKHELTCLHKTSLSESVAKYKNKSVNSQKFALRN